MAYGIDPSLPERIESWRKHGYHVQVMTGVAWGQYQDYLDGRFDGKKHWDEAQTRKDGTQILHGPTVPYISPGEAYGRYLTIGIKRALDAGAEAIYLEEPEYWAAAGWSPNFKLEWQKYYGEPWQDPSSSVDAQYRTSKLKYFLYRRALSQVFDFVHQYGQEHGRKIPCYVATHSLINYAEWSIVSPESSLISVGADGYIAQVWTGTARTPNVYQGVTKERTFEAAFLEYGAMQNLVRASGRRVWYLNDPIEDNPNHSWQDYRSNWESTLTASLLQPEVWRYEVLPWPDRIFGLGPHATYPTKNASDRKPGEAVERVPIPKDYETELQTVFRALGEMKQPTEKVRWEHAGTGQIGVLVSDTLLFQRADPHPSDSHLGSFYGLAMPLLKAGIPVEPVQIESAESPGFLDRYRILLLTYEGQKPPTPEIHDALAQWVRKGGALIVIDDDRDPYLGVREWWNNEPLAYATPRQQLFEKLGIAKDATGQSSVGKGFVVRIADSPAALSYRSDGAALVRKTAQEAAQQIHLPWKESSAFVLRRGPYLIAAQFDESTAQQATTLNGHFIDLFDATLPIRTSVSLTPGTRKLLFDLDAVSSKDPGIVAAAGRVKDQTYRNGELRFTMDGIAGTNGVVRLKSPYSVKEVQVAEKVLDPSSWTEEIVGKQKTILIRIQNSADPTQMIVRFRK